MVLVFALSGCGQSQPSATAPAATTSKPAATTAAPAATTAAPAATTAAPAPSQATQPIAPIIPSTTAAAEDPNVVKGGILRQISSAGPVVLGYFSEMGPGDEIATLPACERLLMYDASHRLVPNLAESWEYGPDKMSMIFHLRKGIKFHDGSDFNAEAVAWNYQMAKDSKRMQYNDKLKSVEVVDPYTVKLNLTTYHTMLILSFGWVPMQSKVAFEKNGKEWARLNPVGTGAFMLQEFKRDAYIKWVKNPNYWRTGKPYLDGITVNYVPDTTTASAQMQAGQADWWTSPTVKDQQELVGKGLVRQSGYGSPWLLLPNAIDPSSKWRNKSLREALEYAIDRPALAKALGFGFYEPLANLAATGQWGHTDTYIRPYNKDKAKQMLTAAGYPNGLKIKLTALTGAGGRNTVAESVRLYLIDAGFEVDLDIADNARFVAAQYKEGFQDLLLVAAPYTPNMWRTCLAQLGPEMVTNWVSYYRSPEFVEICKQASLAEDEKDRIAFAQKMLDYLANEAMITPLYAVPTAYIIQPNVHTTYLVEHGVEWYSYNVWLGKK